MAAIQFATMEDESANVASTFLNGLANGSTTATAIDIDNSSAGYLYLRLIVELGSITPGTNGSITYRIRNKRGANYEDLTPTLQSDAAILLSGASTKRVIWPRIVIPGKVVFGLHIVNNSGVAFAASGNAIYYQRFNEEVV